MEIITFVSSQIAFISLLLMISGGSWHRTEYLFKINVSECFEYLCLFVLSHCQRRPNRDRAFTASPILVDGRDRIAEGVFLLKL